MTPDFAEQAFPVLLNSLRVRLQEALATTRAAEAYLDEIEGNRDGALSLILEAEPALTEATTLLTMAAIVQRRARRT